VLKGRWPWASLPPPLWLSDFPSPPMVLIPYAILAGAVGGAAWASFPDS
jgi:ABC-type uncharacterized transport system permease subunit